MSLVQAMPRPALARRSAAGVGDGELAAALAESALLAGGRQQEGAEGTAGDGGVEAGSPPPPAAGVSFANMARLGYAATGPVLGSGPALGSSPLQGAAAALADQANTQFCLTLRSGDRWCSGMPRLEPRA